MISGKLFNSGHLIHQRTKFTELVTSVLVARCSISQEGEFETDRTMVTALDLAVDDRLARRQLISANTLFVLFHAGH